MLVPTSQVTGGGNAGRSSNDDANGKRKVRLSPTLSGERTRVEPLGDDSQLDAGKQALKALLKEKKSNKKNSTSCGSLLKLYATILAGLMIIGGLFTLLFLVPMKIDPALATLTYEFHPKPALCMTTFAEWVTGTSTIDWCSCTEGCTSEVYNCSQVNVVYKTCHNPEDSSCELQEENTSEPDPNNYLDPAHWKILNASLYINVKGCGYPPEVNCSTFYKEYGVPGRRFWCYFSTMDPYLVMPEYDPQAAELELVTSLGYTIGAQLLGIFIIVVLHCPFVSVLKNVCRRKTVLHPKNLGGVVNHGASSSMTSLVGWKDKDKPRPPVFQRDWYDVHT